MNNKITKLEQDYLNALECGDDNLLAIYDELLVAYAEHNAADQTDPRLKELRMSWRLTQTNPKDIRTE